MVGDMDELLWLSVWSNAHILLAVICKSGHEIDNITGWTL